VAAERRALALGPLAAVVGAAFVALGTLLGGGAGHTAAQSDSDAATIYLRDCAVCHGADGHGTSRGPTLVAWGAAGVYYAVFTGRMPLASPGATPTRRTPAYDQATIDALVAYVDRLVPGGPAIPQVDPAAGDLAEGGQLFRAQCAACHQWAGQGGALLHREAPALSSATPTQAAAAVRTGPGAMPVFAETALDDHQLNSVLRYIEALKQPEDRGGWALWHIGPVAEGGVGLAAVGVLMFVLRYVGTRQ
jgi:quinol---cytochrome-c reductase cytochrome c subunit